MERSKILLELESLKSEISKLNIRIDNLAKIVEHDNEDNDEFRTYEIKPNETMLNKFQYYLENVKKLKSGSIKNYSGELRKIKVKFLEFLGIDIPYEIYQIDDLNYLNKLLIKFKESGEFIELNKKAHHSLSAAFNNYIAFLEYNRTDFVIDEE